MANMSYSRFENTYRDLQDCVNAMSDTDLSESETKYRGWVTALAKEIVNDYGDELNDEDTESE